MTLISEFLGGTTAPMIGVIGDEGTKVRLGDHHDDEDEPCEHPLETEFRKSLKLVKILADDWDIPFDPVLYASTIKRMEKNRDGVWHSSSLHC